MLKRQGDLWCRNGRAVIGVETAGISHRCRNGREMSGVEMAGISSGVEMKQQGS